MDETRDGLKLAELAKYILRHVALVVFPMIAGGLLMYILAAYLITPSYVSDIKLSVYTRPEQQINPAGNLQADTYLVQDYAVVIKSRTVAERVIKELHLMKDGEPMDVTAFLENNVVVNPGDGTSRIITVSIVYDDPFLASDIAEKYGEISLETIKKIYEADNIRVVDGAKIPLEKYSPNILKFILLGVVLGAMAGIAVLIILFIMSKAIGSKAVVKGVHVIYRDLTLVALIAVVVFALLTGYLFIRSDRKGPEIVFSGDSVKYDGLNEQLLMADVSAVDDVDGDVTATLHIKAVMDLDNETIVTYLAKDKSNNITESNRHIRKNE